MTMAQSGATGHRTMLHGWRGHDRAEILRMMLARMTEHVSSWCMPQSNWSLYRRAIFALPSTQREFPMCFARPLCAGGVREPPWRIPDSLTPVCRPFPRRCHALAEGYRSGIEDGLHVDLNSRAGATMLGRIRSKIGDCIQWTYKAMAARISTCQYLCPRFRGALVTRYE